MFAHENQWLEDEFPCGFQPISELSECNLCFGLPRILVGKMYFWWIVFQWTLPKLEMSNVAQLFGGDAQCQVSNVACYY